MADEDVSESFSEWQQIPSPSSATGNNDVVNTREDLPITNTDDQLLQEPHNSAAVNAETTVSLHDGDDNEKGEGNIKWWKKHLRELTSRVVYKIRNYAVCKVGIGTFTSTATRILAVLLVSLFYVMIQRRRRQRQIDTSNNLMLLIKEKDQKIDQLLLQISQMNDSLLARREVPVLRVS